MKIEKKNMLVVMRTLRFIAAPAMLAAVLAGAAGYEDPAKLYVASVGALFAIFFKTARAAS